MRHGGFVIPIFIWSPEEEDRWQPGAASRWWLHQSLAALDATLRQRGSRLIIRRGPTLETIRELLEQSGATAVYWSRRYEPAVIARDRRVKSVLHRDGVIAETLNGDLLFEPGTVRTQVGRPYQVFSSFWKACLVRGDAAPPEPAPSHLERPRYWPASLALGELGLEPSIDWAVGLRERWNPGEAGAREQLNGFLERGLREYPTGRDRPDQPGTSRLSPYLHFGEISTRQIWFAVGEQCRQAGTGTCTQASRVYARELGWREFAYHLLFHFPHTPEQPLRKNFDAFPWKSDRENLRAWQRGRTGYPIVDAGMRELWHTGWMHNRVRMVVASFLVKDLLIPWQEGAAWFWDTLVDADLANNTLGWQWSAGCGADAAPYFRIFNPVSQGEKFDPDGDYVRRWVPELNQLPSTWIHKPWEAPADALAVAEIELGRTYPWPIVDHREARARALEALSTNQELTLSKCVRSGNPDGRGVKNENGRSNCDYRSWTRWSGGRLVASPRGSASDCARASTARGRAHDDSVRRRLSF